MDENREYKDWETKQLVDMINKFMARISSPDISGIGEKYWFFDMVCEMFKELNARGITLIGGVK